jgi:hypothetical protein
MMLQSWFSRSLGAALVLLPGVAVAQHRGAGGSHRGGPVGVIVGPRPSPQSLTGFGTLHHERPLIRDFDDRSRFGHDGGFNRPRDRGIGSRYFGGRVIEVVPAVPYYYSPYSYSPYYSQQYVPYDYYAVPARTRMSDTSGTPSKPYDPTKSKTVWIGEGLDGGGGVMKIEHLSDNQLRLTWKGSERPVRRAELFLADSARQELRVQNVDVVTPAALFHIADVSSRIAYTGLTLVYSDGATETWLVPYDPNRR